MSVELKILADRVMMNAGISMEERLRHKADVPIYRSERGINRYNLKTLGCGQHIFVPYRGKTRQQIRDSLTSCIAHARRKYGMTFTQKSGALGIRIWRIS